MTIAHYFTLLRLILIPLFMLVYLHPDFLGLCAHTVPWILALIMALSELSDACDGYLARRFNQVTELGKLLDPMADSLSRLAVYFCFSQGVVRIPLEIPILMLYRDIAVSTLRTICALHGFVLAARWSGKMKAVIQAVCAFSIVFCVAALEQGLMSASSFHVLTTLLALIACGFSLFSGGEYFVANQAHLRRLLAR